MKKYLFAVVAVFLFIGAACADEENDIVIKRGTEILVRTLDRITSKTVRRGEVIRFVVERGAKDENGFTLIKDGATAYGTVTKVARAGLFGAGGKLGIAINSVEAYNGKIVMLTGNRDDDGGNVSGISIVGALVTPWTLLFRGTNAVIEAGTLFAAYVASDTVLEEFEEEEEEKPAEKPTPPKPAPKKKKKTTKKRK